MLKCQLSSERGLKLAIVLFGVCWSTASAAATTFSGEPRPLGNGTVNTYVTVKDDGLPLAIGIRMTETALQGLPGEPNASSRCFDLNSDGKLEAGNECLGDYESVMNWPTEAEKADLPFRWMGLNWNARGHHPKNVYDLPHFDIHFYMAGRDAITSIRPGPCGEFVDCEDFERARVPVAPQYLPAGHADVGAVVPAMGNHLLHMASPELSTPGERFTHTLIYGAYDGEIIFIEPMVTREFLLSKPVLCVPMAQPAAWQKPSRYPRQYCMRYLPEDQAFTISLEDFTGPGTAMETNERNGHKERS